MPEETKDQWQIDENEYVTCRKVVDCPKLDKTVLYNRAMNFFNANYSDVSSVILERDLVNGIIIGKGVFKKVLVSNSELRYSFVDTWYILKVEVRDGRARITMLLTQYDEAVRGSEPPDIHYLYPVSKQYPFNPESYRRDLYKEAYKISQQKALETIAAVGKALLTETTQSKKDSW